MPASAASQVSSGQVLGIECLTLQASAGEALILKTPKGKMSYALGIDLGNNFRKGSIDLDPAVFARALQDALSGSKTLLSEEEVSAVIRDLQIEQRRKQIARDKKDGEAFLAENKTKEGVVTLESGLQYKILKAGCGRKPNSGDTVVCQYRGTLIDGTEFDSSYKRNQPVIIPVKEVIKGWADALQLMPVGSKWQLFISPRLARVENWAGGDSLGSATLIFELELISIRDKS